MTTFAELFEQEPLRIERGVSHLAVYARPSYFAGARIDVDEIHNFAFTDGFCKRVEQVVFHAPYRGTRMQDLVGYRFDGRWVMITRTAGRPDFTSRQIVDVVAWRDMMRYIEDEFLRVAPVTDEELDVVSLDDEVEFTFYGDDVRDARAWWL